MALSRREQIDIRQQLFRSNGGEDASPADRWGLILAGGDGTRLLPLTRLISGDDRPKQFCPIVGGETLVEQTQRRMALKIPSAQTFVVVTRTHERFYAPLLADVPPQRLVVQPDNQGTAPAILYSVLRLAAVAPMGSVAILPSDHYVTDDEAFMLHMEAAFHAVQGGHDRVVLLGVAPETPEVEYGWIEPGAPIRWQGTWQIYGVRRFCEKPPLALAQMLMAQGGLWNSFVMVTRIPTLLRLIHQALPDMARAFDRARKSFGTAAEPEVIRGVYDKLPATNFSQQVLAARPRHLAVLPVHGVGWSDLGNPRRVLRSLGRLGVQERWAEPAAAVGA